MKWYRSFRIKTLLIFFSMMILIVVAINIIIMGKVQDDIEQRVYTQNIDAAKILSESFDLFFSGLKDSMVTLSNVKEVRHFDVKNTDDLLKQIVDKNPSISQIYLMDKEGMQYYKTSHLDTLGSRADRDYFQMAITGQIYVSDIVVSRSTGKPITVVAVPIYDGDEIVGVLGASIDLTKVDHFISTYNYEKEGYALIVDQNGRIILHPNEEYIDSILDISDLEPVKAVVSGQSGIGRYHFKEEERLVAYASTKEMGWGVLVQTPVKFAFKEIDEIKEWLMVILSMTIFCLVMVSIVLSNYFMAPINEIVRVIEGIQKKRGVPRFKKKRKDEYGLIQDAFVKMMAALNDAHEFLEEQVQERTTELSIMNQELTTTNDKLKSTVLQLECTQEKLIESEKISALARIGVRISHELNTPLGVCLTTSTFLNSKTSRFREKLTDDMIKREYVESYLEIVNESMRILEDQLIKSDKIIGYLKESPLEFQWLEKQEVSIYKELLNAKESFKEVFNCPSYDIQISCDEDISIINGHGIIQEVIKNLLDNSFKHGCSISDLLKVRIDVSELDNEVVLTYTDNGVGMNQEELDYVFEPMFKKSMGAESAGMGLTKVYYIVTNILNGDITFDKNVSEGIKVTIVIPK
ncbi:MAG: hypothetical protein JEZ08_06170 [Clostridiales bacterium]|nr:hypothetical protein [Clostridiales bacterium]